MVLKRGVLGRLPDVECSDDSANYMGEQGAGAEHLEELALELGVAHRRRGLMLMVRETRKRREDLQDIRLLLSRTENGNYNQLIR